MGARLPSRFPDVVVLLPGIIGSTLSKDGRAIWGLSAGAAWRLLLGDGLKALELSGQDNGADDLGDGITATGLVPNAEVIPGLWKHGGYSMLSAELVSSLGLEPDQNFFEFPYDWRRDNRVAARRLARETHDWLKNWRETSGNADAKLILVVHSMGGLVARHFVEHQEGWRSVRLLLSFGTPYRGSGRALNFLSNGFQKKLGPISVFNGTDALRSFDSVYQLLPIYPFVVDPKGMLAKITELTIPYVDGARVSAAFEFHEEVREAAAQNASLEDYRARGAKLRPVVGTEQPTFQSATLVDGRVEMSETYEGAELRGDGTVSRVSAIPIGADEATATYVATSHAALNSVSGAFEHLRGVITGSQIDLDRFRRDTAGAGAISLHVPDAFEVEEPVVIAASTSSYVQSLDAVVQRLDEPAPAVAALLLFDAGIYRTELELPAGLYRLTISRKNFQPVSDVFLVAAPASIM